MCVWSWAGTAVQASPPGRPVGAAAGMPICLAGLSPSPAGPFPAMSLVPRGCGGPLLPGHGLPPLSWGDETLFWGRCPRAEAPRGWIHVKAGREKAWAVSRCIADTAVPSRGQGAR